VAQKEASSAVSPSTPSRRDVLKAGVAGAAAVGTAAVLGPQAVAQAAPAKRRASAKTVLTVMSWEPYQQLEFAAWKKVTNDFMAANPSIQVNWTGWPFTEYEKQIITQAQAGEIQADVVQCTPEIATTLITNYNLAQPLDQITTSLGLIPNNAHNQFRVNGKLYALGIIEVAFTLRYDKRILKEAGFSGPPTTLDQWLHMTKVLTKPPAMYGNDLLNVVADGDQWWNQFQNFCLPYDGAWARGKKLTINAPENVKGLEYWLQLVKASGLVGSNVNVIQKLYYDDRVAFGFDVAIGAVTVKAAAPKLWPNLRTAAPPWPNKKAISRLHPVVVPKSTKNQDAAMELAKWMVTPKNLWYVMQQNGYPDIPFTNITKFVPQYAAFAASQPWTTGVKATNYVGEGDIFGEYSFAYTQIGNIVQGNMEKVIAGSMSVKDALDASQATAVASIHL
jgi:ABC-type glycerol-3-phosphate transport system substrate-binding protein